ncbi:YdgH/BhsA/McbA-like domain containing protein [Enterobacteriaceae bacterium LUAb1]
MKITFTVATIALFSLFTAGVNAASLITSQQVQKQNLQSIGTITVSGIDGSPMTIREALSQKADKLGASKYRIIEAMSNGNYHATAHIYK